MTRQVSFAQGGGAGVHGLCTTRSRKRAPKARNMKAWGKREAKRSASPLVRENDLIQR
jgi:hypothetical protein